MSIDLDPYDGQLVIRGFYGKNGGNARPHVKHTTCTQSLTAMLAIHLVKTEWKRSIMSQISKYTTDTLQLQGLLLSIKAITATESSRRKRAILPIIGDLLSSLIGTATTRDLDQLKRNFRKLQQNQGRIVHVVEESLTLINKTSFEVQMNRDAMNHLSRRLRRLDDHVTNVIKDIETNVHPILLYQNLMQGILDSFRLVSDAIQQNYIALSVLLDQTHEVLQGRFPPSLVTPPELRSLLTHIRKNAPVGFVLPVDPSSEITWYYKNIVTAIIPDSNRLHIIAIIPLVQTESLYTIHKSITVPMPHLTENIEAEYKLEADYLPISSTGNHYILLDHLDVVHCTNADIAYCSLANPMISFSTFPNCVSALFYKRASLVTKYCQPIFKPKSKFPVVKHLKGDKWLISTAKPFSMRKTCAGDHTSTSMQTFSITDPISILTLGS